MYKLLLILGFVGLNMVKYECSPVDQGIVTVEVDEVVKNEDPFGEPRATIIKRTAQQRQQLNSRRNRMQDEEEQLFGQMQMQQQQQAPELLGLGLNLAGLGLGLSAGPSMGLVKRSLPILSGEDTSATIILPPLTTTECNDYD